MAQIVVWKCDRCGDTLNQHMRYKVTGDPPKTSYPATSGFTVDLCYTCYSIVRTRSKNKE